MFNYFAIKYFLSYPQRRFEYSAHITLDIVNNCYAISIIKAESVQKVFLLKHVFVCLFKLGHSALLHMTVFTLLPDHFQPMRI